jgi:hypothetical protein
MRIALIALAAPAALLVSGCGTGGVLGRDRPDEFAVARNAPLVIPPDFALTPPRPGEAAAGADARTQALQALFARSWSIAAASSRRSCSSPPAPAAKRASARRNKARSRRRARG